MAGDERIDELARKLGHAVSRRAALRRTGVTLAAGLLGATPTRPALGHPQDYRGCTTRSTDDGLVFQIEQTTTFRRERLSLILRIAHPFPEPDALTTTLDVRLAARPVLTTIIEGAPEQPTRGHLLYGDAFTGIRESIALNDGEMVAGEIDGRRVVPRQIEDVQRDPGATEFEDGNPPPVTTTDSEHPRMDNRSPRPTLVVGMHGRVSLGWSGPRKQRHLLPGPGALRLLVRDSTPFALVANATSNEVSHEEH